MPRLTQEDDDNGCALPQCIQHFHRMEDHICFLDKRMLEQFANVSRERDATALMLDKRLDATALMLDKRLDSMNEFRESLKDQSSLMLTRKEHEAYLQKVEADLRILRESRALIEGKASQANLNATFLLALLGTLAGLLALIVKIFK